MCNELMDQFNTGKEGRLEEIIRKKENKGRREEKKEGIPRFRTKKS